MNVQIMIVSLSAQTNILCNVVHFGNDFKTYL